MEYFLFWFCFLSVEHHYKLIVTKEQVSKFITDKVISKNI